MKKLFLFIIPISLIIIINETSQFNSSKQCSWQCHNNTFNCKENHTKLLKPYINKIDIIYNFIIQSLTNTGNYKQANILYLVIIWPIIMLGLSLGNIFLFQKLRNGTNY